MTVPAARVGNALHFLFDGSASILMYDVAARGFSVIERPPQCSVDFQGNAVLMSMDDGRLGFAAVRGHGLRLWAREVGADGVAAWVQRKAIRLNTHGNGLPYLIAYGVGVFFVWTAGVGLSLVNLRSNQVTKAETDDRLFGVVPYITYCIPALRGGIFGIEGDGPNAGA
ncbi:uncharacterized protein [Miscanthus floridulus]|uniref:uncharacterized protein n=1 Tax=Miscanthus floridulus TaxID=154761 RepID=UPI003457BD00